MAINREIRFITAGNQNSVSQVFYNNFLEDSRPTAVPFFSFRTPLYYTYGGTLSYYSQDSYAIFTNILNPPIRFVFTANTSSFSGDSYFVHEIYKLDYQTFKLYSDNQINQEFNISSDINRDDTSIIGSNKNSRDYKNNNSLQLGGNKTPLPEKFFGQPLTSGDLKTIQNYFTNPLITITASTSAVTGFIYDLFIPQYVKKLGNYSDELFTDKAQFFVNTKIVFNVGLGKNYLDFYQLINGSLIPSGWTNQIIIQTETSSAHTISSGPFSGINVAGNFFTYFIVPDKPVFEYPIMSGQLSTFTPEFRWSNGDKADSFLLQINYNINDTGFTGTVYNYPVAKEDKYIQVSQSKTKGPDTEFSTNKNIYTHQIPIRSQSNFIYRVGNSKELIDIFDTRRTVVTFSEFFSATTQQQKIQVYVNSQSDSKNTEVVDSLGTPVSLDYESSISTFTLSGVVTGSIVTGATMSLLCPNSSFITTMTNTGGTYSFSGLQDGNYTLTTNYRGYQEDNRTFNISGDTSLNFKIKLLWSDNFDTWGKMAGENYYT